MMFNRRIVDKKSERVNLKRIKNGNNQMDV